MSDPVVDHIIAVHDLRRPVKRAVGSVLDGTRASLRVTVVCHNLREERVEAELGHHAKDPRLRLIGCHDGIASPSGPFNRGLSAATGTFTSIMGSDDELEPGAIDSWLRLADRTGSTVIIARVVIAGRGPVLTPPVRVGRRTRLDGVRDRLSYRSAPLGLVSRARFGQLRFPEGLSSGEDVEYVTRLWYSGAPIALDARGPAYLVHDDAPERVSTMSKPVATDAEFLHRLFDGDAFRELDAPERDALVTKILRGNVLQWITVRQAADWNEADLTVLGDAIQRCHDVAPRAFAALSRVDRAILDAFTSVPVPLRSALALVPGRTNIRMGTVLPRSIGWLLARESPLRFGLASKVLARSR